MGGLNIFIHCAGLLISLCQNFPFSLILSVPFKFSFFHVFLGQITALKNNLNGIENIKIIFVSIFVLWLDMILNVLNLAIHSGFVESGEES